MLEKNGIISRELRSIIENTNDLVFVKDRNSVYIACSKSYALDCVRCNSVEEVIGKTDLELFQDQSIAEKYRADDRELFASGKLMTEFQEEFPDKDGKKHACMTTKFVLHDENGKPVALFGQYHDIGKTVEEEIGRRIDMERKITAAVNSIFYASYFIDLENNTFKILKGIDYAKMIFKDCKTIKEACELFIRHLVVPEDQEKMREFCDLETLKERLGNNTHIDCEYRGTFVKGWCQTSFLPVSYDKNGNVTHVLFVVSIIDSNRAKNLEEGITLRNTSIQSYKNRLHMFERSTEDALCVAEVNLTKNSFSNVHAEGNLKKVSESARTLDELMQLSSQAVFDPEEQQKYLRIFQHAEMLQRFEHGETQIRYEHFYRDDEQTMMVATIFDLIKEPITGDVVGIAYAKNLNEENVSRILLNAALKKDYPMVALVYSDTGEYYLYEVDRGEYCTHKKNYWEMVSKRLYGAVEENELEEIRSSLSREKVLAFLENHEEYSYAFYGQYLGKRFRVEAVFRYADQKHHLLIATLRNITDEILYQKYKYDSEHDILTKLYNRNKVFSKARKLLLEHPNEQFVMLHCDIRHFHLYNTFFGETEGDRLLCEIADLLRTMSDDYDYWAYGRIESDVFCAFFPIAPEHFEEHVRAFIKKIGNFRKDFPLIPAIGAYWVTDPQMSMEEMFTYATIAAKSGKINLYGLISRYDEEMDQNLKDTQQITSEMHTAIDKEQFEVYLQPKYSLQSDCMVGAEALVRWKHPKRGMISPGKFIPAFEKNGFIAELDKYMWEHTCRLLHKWKEEGKTVYPVSVNISRVSMYSHATIPFLKSLIEKYQLDPKELELELTESAYMDDPEDLKRMLKELQEYGFKILMDDFGSGYSSLNTLRDLPVNVLKLDMKFLPTSKDDVRGNAVLSSVVRMSKLLKLPIVAEGVETKEQADYLRRLECDYVQGYLYARPMPSEEYEKKLG